MVGSRPALVVIVGVLLTIAARVPSVSGEQWLTNGGFESGTSPWNIPSGVVTAACDAQEGGGAFGVTSTGTNTVAIRQTILGPLPPGEYTLTGWSRVREGTAQVGIVLALTGPSGFPTGFTSPEVVPTGGDYTPFSLSTSVPWEPESILVALHVLDSSGAEVCFDSLELTTVATEPTSTPTPTPTSPPQTEATATPTATSPAGGSPATATSTATVPAASATPRNTATTSPSPTSGPTFSFVNGGFEDGLTGWSKYGGELHTTPDALNGSQAGLLVSGTESTKWAYQPVRVDPGAYYEFSGHVQPDGGVREAYLRISWYPTQDASGPAMGTVDSLERTGGGTGAFAFLTTGSVQAPAGAASARVRVMLAPAGGGPASLRIDDVAFGPAGPPTPTPTPTETPSSTTTPPPEATAAGQAPDATTPAPSQGISGLIATPVPRGADPAGAAPVDAGTPGLGVEPPPQPFAQVAEVRVEVRSPTPITLPASPLNAPREEERELPWLWLAGLILLAVGLGGAYWQRGTTRP